MGGPLIPPLATPLVGSYIHNTPGDLELFVPGFPLENFQRLPGSTDTPFRLVSITLHYITLSAFQTPPTPKVTSGASTITCHTKYSPPPITQVIYTASRVRSKRKISCAAAQIAATLTMSFPRWRQMS